jgi:nicotinate phosphoribosyltransferase
MTSTGQFPGTSTAFLTDMYELTMLQAALQDGTAARRSVFEVFARRVPLGRGYGVVAGTERAIQAVNNFTFTEAQLSHLSKLGVFTRETLTFLENYRFTGELIGYREGDLFFPNSPIFTVVGTFADAVLLETVLLSIFNHDSAVAAAASRMRVAAGALKLIEMGSRRTHEGAAVAASRAAFIAGFDATSNMEAGFTYAIPTTGTSAHAFTLLHGDEVQAFTAQVAALGKGTTLLVDTYDIEQGIRNAVAVAGPELGGIRIDSGDLVLETFRARKLLNELGAPATKIVLSSDIDEFMIERLMKAQAPVDVLGAGTRVVTGSGHPAAGMVYKLVAHEATPGGELIPVEKRATGKKSVGGRKTAYRTYSAGKATGEFVTVGEHFDPLYRAETEILQRSFGKQGHYQAPDAHVARRVHQEALETLPEELLATEVQSAPFTVEVGTI